LFVGRAATLTRLSAAAVLTEFRRNASRRNVEAFVEE
jgi:hypothetical protein